MLLKRMETLMAQGEVLAVHCLAGRGRTGTVLAAWWIREGLTARKPCAACACWTRTMYKVPSRRHFCSAMRTSSSKRLCKR